MSLCECEIISKITPRRLTVETTMEKGGTVMLAQDGDMVLLDRGMVDALRNALADASATLTSALSSADL